MANNSYQPAAGYKGLVQIFDADDQDITLCANEFTWDARVDALDVTSFCSEGYREYIGGLADVDLSFSGVWDYEYNPFAGPPIIKIGSNVKAIFGIDPANHPDLTAVAEHALVVSWNIVQQADGTCHYTCTLKGNWKFTDFANTNARFVPEE